MMREFFKLLAVMIFIAVVAYFAIFGFLVTIDPLVSA